MYDMERPVVLLGISVTESIPNATIRGRVLDVT